MKRLILQITKGTNKYATEGYTARRNLDALGAHLRRDVGLPPHTSAFSISRCSEARGSNLAAEQLISNIAQQPMPLPVALQASIGLVFVDIHGFTTLSEGMPPRKVMLLLQEFLGRMEMIAHRHGGSLSFSAGDTLLITFGIPRTGSSDATNALACAREMLNNQRRWNRQRAAAGDLSFAIGMGVHYGPVVSGDMGGTGSTVFAVIGDTVNVANRLEALTRSLETDLVVSTPLIEKACQETPSSRQIARIDDLVPIGAQDLRGRSEKISVHILPKGRDAGLQSPTGYC